VSKGGAPHGAPEVVRDPLWNNIRLEPDALAVLDTPAVQRLRYVRQLGHAFLVYPGATHTRFEHALGAYHLARRAIAQLEETAGRPIDPASARLLKLAALLHDIGHYPFSHALEEAGLPNHERLAARHLTSGELAGVLDRLTVSADAVLALIQGRGDAPFGGLISGSIDVDKLDYLSRDSWMCGVPYGLIDVDRLLTSLVPVSDAAGRSVVAIHDKGLAALESLLFAKYQMYRTVYWHHAVRSATAMFKRLVRDAIATGRVRVEDVALATDDGLIHELQRDDPTGLAQALRERRLAKRALDLPATDLPADVASWPAADPDLCARVEDQLAAEVGLDRGELFLDFPMKPGMLALDIALVRRDGDVARIAGPDAARHLGLSRVDAELYRSARRLRVFVLRPATIPAERVVDLVMSPPEAVAARLDRGTALLSSRGRG